jgi:hypothetical protein
MGKNTDLRVNRHSLLNTSLNKQNEEKSNFRKSLYMYIFHGAIALWARTSSLSKLHDHAQTHHDQQVSSGLVISPTRIPLPDNTQHSQETDFHTLSGTRTRNSSKRAAADPRLRPLDHWDRLENLYIIKIFLTLAFIVWYFRLQHHVDL